MTGYDFLEYERRDKAVVIRLDRPEKMNALSNPLMEEIVDSLERSETDSSARAVVITGNGDAFSSGYDFSGDAPGGTEEGPPTAAETTARAEYVAEFLSTVFELDLPVIAAVNGYALAGGSTLALTSDLTIASEQAEFGYPAVRMGGFPPVLVEPYVGGSIKHVRELLYTGKRISAGRAERYGMINRAVPHEDLMSEVLAEVDEIAKVPSANVKLAKQSLNAVMEEQGYQTTSRFGRFLLAYGHQTEAGQKVFEIKENEGVGAAIDWMYEADKP